MALTGAGPVIFKMKARRDTSVQCRAMVRLPHCFGPPSFQLQKTITTANQIIPTAKHRWLNSIIGKLPMSFLPESNVQPSPRQNPRYKLRPSHVGISHPAENSAIRIRFMILPNVAHQRPRATGARYETEGSSRGSLHALLLALLLTYLNT